MTATKIFVTGGAGYVGSLLVPALLSDGHFVTVYDTLWFGKDFLPNGEPRLTVEQGDIRDIARFRRAVAGHDVVINLACISNDASFELDEELSTSVNLHAFKPLVKASKESGVRRFIHASSSSVYGVSDSLDVTEDHPLVPLTLYNRFKGESEPMLLEEVTRDFVGVIIRPATLCGYAPRQRLDLSVNILTNHGFHNGVIKVFGGTQMRPNLHVRDMVEAYRAILGAEDETVQGEIFNCGFQNMSIAQIAETVAEIVPQFRPDFAKISTEVIPSNDQRSYHVNSDKITRILGFHPRFTVADAVSDLCEAFSKGLLPNSFNDTRYFNVRRLKELEIH